MTDPIIYKKAADKEWGRKALSNAFGATDPENAAASASVKNTIETNYLDHALNGEEQYEHLVASRTNAAVLTQAQRKKDDDAKEFMLEQLHRQAEEINAEWWREHIDELNDFIDLMRQRQAELQAKITEYDKIINFYTGSHARLQIAINHFDKEHSFERDKDGKLVDKEVQRALDAYVLNVDLNPNGEIPVSDGAIRNAIGLQKKYEEDNIVKPAITGKHEAETEKSNVSLAEQYAQRINDVLHNGKPKSEQDLEIRKIMQEAKSSPEKQKIFRELNTKIPGNKIIQQFIAENDFEATPELKTDTTAMLASAIQNELNADKSTTLKSENYISNTTLTKPSSTL